MDLLKKRGQKKKGIVPTKEGNKANSAYWAKKKKIRSYRGAMKRADINPMEMITERKFDEAYKVYLTVQSPQAFPTTDEPAIKIEETKKTEEGGK